MSFDHILLHGCEIVDTSGMLIVPYPLCVPPNRVVYAEDVGYADDDDYEDEEYEANESEVQPTRKRKREGAHGKHISYIKASKKYVVQFTKNGKLHYVGSFPTQEEAVVARGDSHQPCCEGVCS